MTDFFLDPTVITILLGVVLPVLVGVVTKAVANSGVKASLLALLAGATGVLAGAQTSGGIVSRETLYYAAGAWVISVASHYGFWKPTGTTDAVQQKTGDFGLG